MMWVIGAGYFPVALVNARIVPEWRFEKNLAGMEHYLSVAGGPFRDELSREFVENPSELRRYTLLQIIEDRLVHDEVVERFGGELEEMVSDKLLSATSTQTLSDAAQTLYGLQFDEFSQIFLEPVAERELLDEALAKENTSFEDWLMAKKQNAKVHLFITAFIWKDGEVLEK